MSLAITAANLIKDVTGQNDTGLFGTSVYDVYFTGAYNSTSIRHATFSGLPKYRADHPNDSLMYAQQIQIDLRSDSDPLGDTTTNQPQGIAQYSITWSQKTLQFAQNPCDRPAKITLGGTDQTEVRYKDKDDNAIVNSTGELYDGIPAYPLGQKAIDIVITRNECTNPATNIVAYSNTVNLDAWHGVAIGKARFGKITADETQEQLSDGTTQTYWVTSYPISIRDDGWRLKLIDAGWMKLVDTDDDDTPDTPRRHTDDSGHSSVKPILLDGTGQPLNDTGMITDGGDDPVIYSNTTDTTEGYKMLDESTWASLSLPNPFA